MAIRLHAIFLIVLISTMLYSGAAAAFELSSGYPQRTNTKRAAPAFGLFDLSASNAGINRADCLDASQRWRFVVNDIPADTTSVEIWARTDGASCAPPAERAGTDEAKSPHCFRVATLTPDGGKEFELDNLSIIQAIDKKKDAEPPLAAKDVCAKSEHMPPAEVHLHLLAFQGTNVVGYTGGADSKPAEIDYVTLYDLAGPPAPTGMTTGAGEGMVTVKLKAPSTAATDFKKYQVYCFRAVAAAATDAGADAGDAGDASDAKAEKLKCPAEHPFVPGAIPTPALDPYKCGESSTTTGDITLDVRDNDIPYAIVLAAIDKQDNLGVLSEVVCETPRATNSFWDNYNAAGGRAGGGCSMSLGEGGPSAASGAIVLAFVALAFCVRRRRVGLIALPALLLFTMPSRADSTPETPSIVMMEARFGPYRPRVDRTFVNGRTPYRDTFGTTPRLMVGAEVEVIPIHIPSFGSIGFGGLVGYTSAKAKAEFADKSGASEEDTSFDLWIFSALTTLRVDVLARRTHVPIVPYAKLGLMTGLWSSSDGRGLSRSPDGRDARGRTNGFLYAVGAMLLLDVFDPEAAKTFAAEHRVKHSYVFGELTVADLRGVGQSYPMRVGDLTWTAGLAFEM